jgi:hypothetical protein
MVAFFRPYLPWHKSRLVCLCASILALIQMRTVNLAQLAVALAGDATTDSNYKRLQRFMRDPLDEDAFALQMATLLSNPKPWVLTLDRTNWEIGEKVVNILVLAIAHQGAAIPLLWTMLDKKGNSNTAERIALLERFVRLFGAARIQCLTADREFVGKQWVEYLLRTKIPFRLRIKANNRVSSARGRPTSASHLLRFLAPDYCTILKGRRCIWGLNLYIAGLRLAKGDYLILITDHEPDTALEDYARRWEIETLFGCLKTRGFRFEDTRLTRPERLTKLIAVLALTFFWAQRIGEWLHTQKPIRIKTHGRRAISLFRLGLDHLRRILVKIVHTPADLGAAIKVLSCT